jgi:hypothetical protein
LTRSGEQAIFSAILGDFVVTHKASKKSTVALLRVVRKVASGDSETKRDFAERVTMLSPRGLRVKTIANLEQGRALSNKTARLVVRAANALLKERTASLVTAGMELRYSDLFDDVPAGKARAKTVAIELAATMDYRFKELFDNAKGMCLAGPHGSGDGTDD